MLPTSPRAPTPWPTAPNGRTPIASQGNVCKHTRFVLLRVLNLSPEDPLVWQKALLSSEVDEVGAGSPLAQHWLEDERWSWRGC